MNIDMNFEIKIESNVYKDMNNTQKQIQKEKDIKINSNIKDTNQNPALLKIENENENNTETEKEKPKSLFETKNTTTNTNKDLHFKEFYFPESPKLNFLDADSDHMNFSNCESFKEMEFIEKTEDKLEANTLKSLSLKNNCEEEDIIFSSKLDNRNNHFQKIEYCLNTLFKITYPDEFYRKILNKEYFTITGSIKSFEVICFAIININYKKRVAEILSFGVLKEFQGKHYGTKLMQKINEEFKLIGIKEVILVVQKTNKIAISLYEKFGFRIFKEDPNYYKVLQGNERNALIMNKSMNNEQFWIFKVFKSIYENFF